ncbi:monooxygenase [Paenibacillus sp. S-38]|uniref:monooxygenase n=1 Tax=Paenibacillus sp. S-38 TaxID=3416710 RepID=UPI003CF8FA12
MDFEVMIVGGGPVGMMLASELALANIQVGVLERLDETTPYSRALSIHPRTLELLDLRGMKPEFLKNGQPLASGHFAGLDTRLDFSLIDSSSNYSLFIPQAVTETILEKRAVRLGAQLLRGMEVLSVVQDEHGVRVTAAGAQGEVHLRAAYLVGADGAGSIVRKQAGIPFIGHNETLTAIQGDVILKHPPATPVVSRYSEEGMIMIVPLPAGRHRVVLIDPQRTHIPKSEPVTLEELRSGMLRILGDDLGAGEPSWLTRFGNAARQAQRYRERRIFLAGDAAHIHFPAGGQGMNVGIQEAFNLGWKLAAERKGWAPPWLLDSYHDERFPVNTSLLHNTEAQTLLLGTGFSPGMIQLRKLMSAMLQLPEANYLLASRIAAVDVRYAPTFAGSSHPLTGRRLPELELRSEQGDVISSFELFRQGSFVLLHLASDERMNARLWPPQIKAASYTLANRAHDEWADVHSVLVRPDGYIAWAVSRSDPDPQTKLRQGLEYWCGPS